MVSESPVGMKPMVAVVSESYTSGIRVGGKVLHVCTQLPLTRHGWDGGGGAHWGTQAHITLCYWNFVGSAVMIIKLCNIISSSWYY